MAIAFPLAALPYVRLFSGAMRYVDHPFVSYYY
jgi:hypothetical protein